MPTPIHLPEYDPENICKECQDVKQEKKQCQGCNHWYCPDCLATVSEPCCHQCDENKKHEELAEVF